MADNTFMLEIVTPEQILFKDEVQFLVAPAVEGEMGVLRNHAPLVATLDIGVLRYVNDGGETKKIAISGGFIEVVYNVVRVLAETAERDVDIDVLRARAAAERARERLNVRNESDNFVRAQSALQRAMARIKAADADDRKH